MHDAFISYSRRNADFARRLEKALEEFKPPRDLKVPQRYLDVFRDETDFTGAEYFQSVERHLGDSAKLIVVCSPDACASTYVGDEIRRFAQKHGPDNIIPILLDGIPNNEASPAELANCAFPAALCEILGMPLAISYRGFDAKKDRVNKGAFADSWFALLANLYGISRADVERREKRRQQRNRRITLGIVSGIMTSLVIALLVSLLFWRQAVTQRENAERAATQERSAKERERAAKDQERVARLDAEAQRMVAEQERATAQRERAAAVREAIAARSETAGRLAVQALEKIDGAPEDALGLALAAVNAFHSHGDPIAPRAMGALQRVGFAFAGSRPLLPWRKDRESVVVDELLEWAAASDPRGTVVFGRAGTSDPQTLSPPRGVLQRGERWAAEQTHLVFAGGRLLAMRGIVKEGSQDVNHGVLWSWRITPNGIDDRPAVASRFDVDWWDRVRPLPSPDGKWLLWDVRSDRSFLQRIDPPGKLKELTCYGLEGCNPREFTGNSRMLVMNTFDEIHRFVLGDGELTELPVMKTELREPVNLAVIANGEAMRIALFGKDGAAEWWEINGTADPQRHELPNFFEAFQKDFEMHGLLDEHRVRTSLAWDGEGEAILATMAEEKTNEFGLVAVHDLKGAAWQPVEHRYELKARETSAQLRGDASGVTGGYRVKNPGNLGAASAIWMGSDVLSTGFDGTVLYRPFGNHVVSEKFQLVDTDASFITLAGRYPAIGKRDGKIRIIESDHAPWNGHGSPIRDVKVVMDWSSGAHLARMVSTDTAGISRIWDFTGPAAHDDSDEVRVTPDWKWAITNDPIQFWPLQLPDPLWSPYKHAAFAKATALAWNADSSQVATLHVEPAARLPVVVRLWSLRGARLPQAPVAERRFAVASADMRSWSLRLATTDDEARLLIDDGEQLWMTDLRQPRQPVRKVAGSDVKLASNGVSPDLRWLVVKRDKEAFVADTRQWANAPKLVPLGGVHVEAVEKWSADRRWIVIRGQRAVDVKPEERFPPTAHFFLDLAANLRVAVVPRVRDLILGFGRPPMYRDHDRAVYMWQPPGRFAPVSKLPDISDFSWDESGRWLMIGHEDGRVWVTQPAAGGAPADLGRELRSALKQQPLPLPAEAEARSRIDRVFAFPEQGWIVADAENQVLIWHRGASGVWDQPLVFTNSELRLDYVRNVRLRPDGRMALIGNRVMSFDPDYLMAYSRRLANGDGK